MMDNKNIRNLIIGGIIVALILIAWIVFELTSDDPPKNATKTPESIFSLNDTFEKDSDTDVTETTRAATTTTTRPKKTPAQTKSKLQELPVTSFIDMYYPEKYLSLRYETIMSGEFVGDDITDTYLYDKIAITELDDPANSDLDAATFSQLRALAIAAAKAQATGEGTSLYPTYFTPATYVDKCTTFSTVAAGAISMPYQNDNSWALGVVYWKATCTLGTKDSAPVVLSSHQNIFLQRGANGWVPVPVSTIPRTSL